MSEIKIKRLHHEEHEEHEVRATKKGIMSVLGVPRFALYQNASLREAFLRVLRGSVFCFGFSTKQVMA